MKAPIRTFTLALVVMFAPALALAEPAAKFHHVAIEVDAQGRSFFADREKIGAQIDEQAATGGQELDGRSRELLVEYTAAQSVLTERFEDATLGLVGKIAGRIQ